MSASITIKFAGNSINAEVNDGTTVGDLLNNDNYKAVLGFGDNVEARISGVTQPATSPVRDGDVLFVATKAASNAA